MIVNVDLTSIIIVVVAAVHLTLTMFMPGWCWDLYCYYFFHRDCRQHHCHCQHPYCADRCCDG